MPKISPSKEKFCSLISEIVDKSKDAIVDTEDVLDYDAVELTLLLKSIGFRLFSVEFEKQSNAPLKDIQIEIRCQKSGMVSKLYMEPSKCTCPSRKQANNNSFWEVQGRSPAQSDIKEKRAVVQDTSCSLLPNITRKTANFAKTMLTVLLRNYQNDFLPEIKKLTPVDITQIVERLNIQNVTTNKKGDITPTNTMTPSNNNANDPNSHCSTPLSSVNITPVPSYDGPIVTLLPKIILQNEKELAEGNSLENQNLPSEISEPNSLNSGKNEPSPIEKENTFDKLNPDNERDICLIKSITEARKQIDSALLLLKCNVTRDLSHSSLLTVTPQNLKKPKPLTPSVTKKLITTHKKPQLKNNQQTVRRNSLGGLVGAKTGLISGRSFLKTPNNLFNDNKRKSTGSPYAYRFSKPDTPRPTNGKKDIASKSKIIRTASCSNLNPQKNSNQLTNNKSTLRLPVIVPQKK